ncbi:MAG: hypothetical protein M3512_14230 [Bacteroidota bacterium]|nr:hypothetical protein [Bacteroidota bacterium]
MKNNKTKQNSLRWLVLVSLLINIFFNYYTNSITLNGQTVGDVSNQFPTLFTPAGYAFSIWGVIYFSLLVYAVYQLLPSQKGDSIYNELALPFISINILSIIWLTLFIYEEIFSSTIAILLMLACSIILFGRSKRANFLQKGFGWISVPFGLYMGWLSVATIANFSILLSGLNWERFLFSETVWTIILTTVALALAFIISYQFKDIVYPLVISWAILAIHVARAEEEPIIASLSLIYAIALVIWSVLFGIWIWKKQPQATSSS